MESKSSSQASRPAKSSKPPRSAADGSARRGATGSRGSAKSDANLGTSRMTSRTAASKTSRAGSASKKSRAPAVPPGRLLDPIPDVPLAKLPAGALLYRPLLIPGASKDPASVGTDELFATQAGVPTLLARSREHALLLADAPPLPTGYSVGNALAQQWAAALKHQELSRRAAARASVQAAAEAAAAEEAKAAASSPKKGSKKGGRATSPAGGARLTKAGSKASLTAAAPVEPEVTETPPPMPPMPPMYTQDDVVAAFGADLAQSPAAGVFRTQNTTVAIAELQCQQDIPLAAYGDDAYGAFADLWKAVLLSEVPPQETLVLQQAAGVDAAAATGAGDEAELQLHSTPTPRAAGAAKAMALEGAPSHPPGGEGEAPPSPPQTSPAAECVPGTHLPLAVGGAFQLLQPEDVRTAAFYRRLALHELGGFVCPLPHRHELARLVAQFNQAVLAGQVGTPPGTPSSALEGKDADERVLSITEGGEGGVSHPTSAPAARLPLPLSKQAVPAHGHQGGTPVSESKGEDAGPDGAAASLADAPSGSSLSTGGGAGAAHPSTGEAAMLGVVQRLNARAAGTRGSTPFQLSEGGVDAVLRSSSSVPTFAVLDAGRSLSLTRIIVPPLPPTTVTLHLTEAVSRNVLSLQFDLFSTWATVAAGLRAAQPALGAAERLEFAVAGTTVFVDQLVGDDGTGGSEEAAGGAGKGKRSSKEESSSVLDGSRHLGATGVQGPAVAVEVVVTMPPPRGRGHRYQEEEQQEKEVMHAL